MKVLLHTKEIETEDFKNVGKLLKHLELLPGAVIVLKNGEIVETTEKIRPDDRMEIIKVMSGG